jgi:hypothetical protein
MAGEGGPNNVRAPIINSLTYMGSLAILGAVAYGGAAVSEESYWTVCRKLP